MSNVHKNCAEHFASFPGLLMLHLMRFLNLSKFVSLLKTPNFSNNPRKSNSMDLSEAVGGHLILSPLPFHFPGNE